MVADWKPVAKTIGILFLVASAAAIVGGLLLLPTQEEGYLAEAAGAEAQVMIGALLEVVLAVSVVGIAVLFFPILRRTNEGMAMGYVAARTLEGALVLFGSLSALVVLALSRDYGESGSGQAAVVGDSLISAREWAVLLGTMVVFGVGALVLYSLLYRSRLVPSWLSIWGFLAAALLMVGALLEMFGQDLGWTQVVFSAPIGLNEVVLAIWLIVKGFNLPTAFLSLEAELAIR